MTCVRLKCPDCGYTERFCGRSPPRSCPDCRSARFAAGVF